MSSEAQAVTERPAVIEFVGTPGSGKSTLALELIHILRDHGVPATGVIDGGRTHASRTSLGRLVQRCVPRRLGQALLWQVFYVLGLTNAWSFCREHRRLVHEVMTTQLRRPLSIPLRGHILYWFLQLGGRRRLWTRVAQAGEVLVVDDGFLHRSIHLSASHLERPAAGWVSSYVDLVPEPDLVVRPLAPPDVCERRVLQRGLWPHSRALSRPQIARYVRHADRAAGFAVARAKERGWQIVEISNGDRAIDDVARDLESAIAPLFAAVPVVGSEERSPA